MSEIKNGGLDQYGAGPFEQQQFGTAGVEGVSLAVLPATDVLDAFLIVAYDMPEHDKTPELLT